MYPRFGIRIHHIQSSDARVPHDHPWTFITCILRGGYTEATPQASAPGRGGWTRFRKYRAGSIRIVRSNQFHFLELEPGTDAWTMFITFRTVQGWGFLVNGFKVPWFDYLKQRAAFAAERQAIQQRDL